MFVHNNLRQRVLTYFFGLSPWVPVWGLKVALWKGLLGTWGNHEASGKGYSRVDTQPHLWHIAARTMYNDEPITFLPALESWGTITHMVAFAYLITGVQEAFFYGPLETPVVAEKGAELVFEPEAIQLRWV